MDEPFGALRSIAESAIARRVFPGCVVGVARAGRRLILPFGSLTYGGETRTTETTLYDMASVTKVVPTLMLLEEAFAEGRAEAQDPLSKHVPEVVRAREVRITLEDLIRRRVSGPVLSKTGARTVEELERAVLRGEYRHTPVDAFQNVAAYLLGRAVEGIFGASLDVLAYERIVAPLGLSGTALRGFESAAPTEVLPESVVCGIVHDESARLFARDGRAVGHAGLFSNAPAMLSVLEYMLAHASRYPYSLAELAPARGKTGFTGTNAVCVPERGLAWVVLSNRTYPKRPADDSAINEFRDEVAGILSDD